jgi:acetylornithine/N-succinyldiaminopimelate aminotransferase
MSDLRQNADAHHILDRDSETLIPVYARYPIVMDYGQGMYLYDTSGNRYLDLMGGLGVNALGHAHPRMVAAMADQAGKLVHLSPQYANRHVVELAERLCALSGLKGVFYSTGGAEAVEGALKLARTHARQNFSHAKQGIVALKKSYHGRTYGSMSVTGQEKYRLDFGPGIPHVSFVDRNSLEELRALADKHNALLIFDEIQCGLGRTGAWFNYTRSGIEPDILILGKPLGGGIPLSALLVNDKLFHSFGMAKHGSTLGGIPLACRMGIEFMQIVEDEGLLQQVTETGAYLRAKLDRLATESPIAVEARGAGLLLGLELTQPARPIAEAALAQGILLNTVQGNVLRFLPPFLLQKHQIDEAFDVVSRIIHNESHVEPHPAPVQSSDESSVATLEPATV